MKIIKKVGASMGDGMILIMMGFLVYMIYPWLIKFLGYSLTDEGYLIWIAGWAFMMVFAGIGITISHNNLYKKRR
jgi:hypothetical protein